MKRPEVKAKITGKKRPDFSAYLRTLTGSKNPNFGNHSPFSEEHKKNISIAITNWHKRQKEISMELLKPEITPETRQVLLTEQDKIKIALQRLESQRLQKIKEFELESANRPKEKINNNFGMKMCINSGKLIKCKKNKAFCSNWNFCHKEK